MAKNYCYSVKGCFTAYSPIPPTFTQTNIMFSTAIYSSVILLVIFLQAPHALAWLAPAPVHHPRVTTSILALPKHEDMKVKAASIWTAALLLVPGTAHAFPGVKVDAATAAPAASAVASTPASSESEVIAKKIAALRAEKTAADGALNSANSALRG